MTTHAVTAETIEELTRDIWTALLNDEVGLVPGGQHTGDIAATVEISGAWNGTACLSCSASAGRLAASSMFALPDDELSDDEVSDAVGELINVVGGNLKSLLPGPTELSLPSVHAGGGFAAPGHLELACEVRFTWLDEPVMVTLWNAGD